MEAIELTERQKQVVALAARGWRCKEIGPRLKISPRTAEIHLAGACKRLGIKHGVRSIMLVHMALRRGWVKVEELTSSHE